MIWLPDYAHLGPDKVARIQTLEDELGIILVAYQRPPAYATLDDVELDELKKCEKSTGHTLVAYE